MPEITDSNLEVSQILAQNPTSICPDEILASIGAMEVHYYGFDVEIHVGQIAVARSVMPEVEAFFRQAYEMRFPIAKVIPASHPAYGWSDIKLMADNVSSGFNYRVIAGTNRPSHHGSGTAFDINPLQNPYIRYDNGKPIVHPVGATWNSDITGTLHAHHPLVKLMEGFGWQWGGHWTPESGRTDYQHFHKEV